MLVQVARHQSGGAGVRAAALGIAAAKQDVAVENRANRQWGGMSNGTGTDQEQVQPKAVNRQRMVQNTPEGTRQVRT